MNGAEAAVLSARSLRSTQATKVRRAKNVTVWRRHGAVFTTMIIGEGPVNLTSLKASISIRYNVREGRAHRPASEPTFYRPRFMMEIDKNERFRNRAPL